MYIKDLRRHANQESGKYLRYTLVDPLISAIVWKHWRNPVFRDLKDEYHLQNVVPVSLVQSSSILNYKTKIRSTFKMLYDQTRQKQNPCYLSLWGKWSERLSRIPLLLPHCRAASEHSRCTAASLFQSSSIRSYSAR